MTTTITVDVTSNAALAVTSPLAAGHASNDRRAMMSRSAPASPNCRSGRDPERFSLNGADSRNPHRSRRDRNRGLDSSLSSNSIAGSAGPALSLLLLLCQEIDCVSALSVIGMGVRRRFQTRRAMWRLRQRMASRLVLPSAFLRAM
jgi:hypothetical protein